MVLTDHSMPATPIDGLELVRRIQAHDQYRNLPIIVYSGGTTNRSEALKAGANDFIEKPYTIGILLETIGKYLSPKSQ